MASTAARNPADRRHTKGRRRSNHLGARDARPAPRRAWP
jgi:hypothetical protein